MRRNIILIVIKLVFNLSTKILIAQNCGTPDVLQFGSNLTNVTATPYWDSIPGAISYNVEYRVRNSGASYSAPISTNTNSLLLTSLHPLTNYEFIVQSVCASGTSPFSTSGWFTTLDLVTNSSITRGPYMTVATSNSVTLQWKTNTSCNSEVAYSPFVDNLNAVVNNTANTTDHSIKLTNLLPNTKYFYSVGSIGTVLQGTSENYFYTAPADNDSASFRFWVTGDFGNGSSAQASVRNSFVNYNGNHKVNGWLWLGDNAYVNGTDAEYQSHVFDIYPSQFKNIPVFPVLGNHDYGQTGYQSNAALSTNAAYFNIFSLPENSGTKKYYSTNYGNVHFVALDSYGSYNSTSSDMYRWLENDLSNNTQQFTIVYFHHPPYSKGSHNSDTEVELIDMRNNIIPLLESNGVDLVISGHSHVYERSNFMKGHFGNANTFSQTNIIQAGPGPYTKASRTGEGTIYVVCGVGGEIAATSPGYPHNAMYYSNASNYGSLILDFNGNSLTGQFLSSTGVIKDSFTITKPPVVTTNSVQEVNKNVQAKIDIYPNPVRNDFSVSVDGLNNKIYKLQIHSLTGQLVFEKSIEIVKNKSVIKIDKNEIEKCVAGLYILSIYDDDKSISKSFIVE